MLILLSPSKTLDFETAPYTKKHTQPDLLDHSQKLITELRKLSPKQIMKMMKVSEPIAELNHQRYQNFTTPFTPQNAKQAILAFRGDVYRDIEIDKYREADFEFAQHHVRTLSGLYGLLRPLDLIQPYRLEMKYRKNYWKPYLTETLNEHIKQENAHSVINLASNEYFSALRPSDINAPVISPIFKEKRGTTYKIIPIYAKLARGTMTNFIIKRRITDPKDLQNFSEDGYQFASNMSTAQEPTFIRG